jgi:hypothetical protein
MNALILQSDSNLQAVSVVIPDTNEHASRPRIVPERFSSTTKPAKVPILPPELGSISEPKSAEQTPRAN